MGVVSSTVSQSQATRAGARSLSAFKVRNVAFLPAEFLRGRVTARPRAGNGDAGRCYRQ